MKPTCDDALAYVCQDDLGRERVIVNQQALFSLQNSAVHVGKELKRL